MKRKFALAVMITLCGLLSSCKKPISGQVFVVTEAGLNFPLGAVQVEVIRAKDADDFMRQRQGEIQSKVQSLQEAYDEAKTNYDATSQVDSQAQAAMTTAAMSEAYTNDPKYVTQSKEKAEDLQTIETLTKAIDYLRPRAYAGWGSINITPLSPAVLQKRTDAMNAINQDNARCRSLQMRINQIDDISYAIKNDYLAPFRDAQSNAYQALTEARAKVNDAATALKKFPTANDYFDGFSPTPIETIVTDAEGNFTIQKPEKGAKVFAKAQRQTLDSVENYFWLIDLPAAGEKLILSNNNMFNVPANSL